ncbi:acyl--CoA ligase [Gordonia desulfuricans]|uniref:Acyl--CoA ligase n=1 Tax=Gordonia desulfuricans TaxID=89051 RepID=A0A7K3LWC7_9ACTN|nr:class I adenylate-forming enzyme family protein [Gordonia desulfuricans]NDK92578.1 acyl--CoA ligase [Gordonia desulfuricans]
MRIEAGSAFTRAAARFGDRLAVIDTLGSRRTYRQLQDRANSAGSGLMASGVKRGDRVGVLSHNRIEVVEVWLGLERFGLVRVVLHSHFEISTHVKTLNEVGASTLVFHEAFASEVAAAREELATVERYVCIGESCPEWAVPYSSVIGKGDVANPCLDVEEDEPCFLQLTTGTTGHPKPWIHTHRSWRGVIENNIEHLDSFGRGSAAVGPDDVNLHFHALQWATGFQTLMPYLLRGALSVVADDSVFDPAVLLQQMIDHRVTGMLIPAPMLEPVLDLIERDEITLPNLRKLVIFFATAELLQRVSRLLGDCWCHGYGSSEQGAPVTRLLFDDLDSEDTWGSIGRPSSSFTEVRVVSVDGEPLGPGEVGEIVVRTPMAAAGYWGLPEKTSAAFFPGGWFRAGDVGSMDADGRVHYLDRAKDMIQTEVGVVYPHVVEARILAHGSVAHCGVTGVRTEVDGPAQVIAAVVLKEETDDREAVRVSILELAADAPEYERPKQVIIVDELPTVLGGAKVQREVLAHLLVAAGTGVSV